MSAITFGVLTISDSCHAGMSTDTSGPKLEEAIKSAFPNVTTFRHLVPDDQSAIQLALMDGVNKKVNVMFTTGGTGFSARDVTPEATKSIIDKEAPGIASCMLMRSLQVTPMAMLSRAVCGIRDKTLIVNLPGSAKGALECFNFIKAALPHAVDLLINNERNIIKVHRGNEQDDDDSKVVIKCAALRDRKSPYPMISVEHALNLILDEVKALFPTDDVELIDINDSLDRILAEDVYSRDPLPPFPASIKDGYAVIAADGVGVRYVRSVIAAGDEPFRKPLEKGEIVRISTGAPIPPGADAVVQVEDTELVEASADGVHEIRVKINVAPVQGQDIRAVGSDIPAKSLVLEKSNVITPSHVGVMATVGKTKLLVHKRFSIGVLSTGNELQNPHECLKPGHIRDSNKLTLLQLLKHFHYTGNDCGIAKDDPNDMKRALKRALSQHDVLITTGGVSMGEFDVVKQVLQTDFGAKIHFGRLNMKPGKPTTFASCIYNGKSKLIFALPGNPVSATVTTILCVLPALRCKESSHEKTPQLKVQLGDDIILDPRPEYMRAQVLESNGIYTAIVTGNQISSRLNSFVGAQVLLILPGKTPECPILKKGSEVYALRI